MMGHQDPPQPKLFYPLLNLESRVRANHPLRAIAQLVDFEFVYKEVAPTYGTKGHVSLPPPVILKLMLLLVFYNVRSERELMATLPERLDWLWFLGFDLDTAIPDHSVLSKARKRWGQAVFQAFFERLVWQCVEAGLVDGSKIFLDGSLIDANASNNSVVDTQSLKAQLNRKYRELEARLDEPEPEPPHRLDARPVNTRYVSTTDPDAAIVRRGKAKLRYQTHRAVDSRSEVMTAVQVRPGDVNEAHLLVPLWQSHQRTTRRSAHTVVADSRYGTIENFLACHDRGLAAHLPDLKHAADQRAAHRQHFADAQFTYDATMDTYRCPADQPLRRKSLHRRRQTVDYAAPKKACATCPLRSQCTDNKSGRTITRHLRQDALDHMRARSRSAPARRDLRMRQHLMERSFARATRYGFDRARWRRLWRVQIQEYLIASIQNLDILLRYGRDPRRRVALAWGEIRHDLPSGTITPRAVASWSRRRWAHNM